MVFSWVGIGDPPSVAKLRARAALDTPPGPDLFYRKNRWYNHAMYNPVSAPQAYGPVTVAISGTPVPFIQHLVALGICAAGDDVFCNDVFMAPLQTNNGAIYVGSSAAMNRATGEGILFVVAPGGGGWQLPNPVGSNIFNVAKWFVDSDISGETLIGSIVQV